MMSHLFALLIGFLLFCAFHLNCVSTLVYLSFEIPSQYFPPNCHWAFRLRAKSCWWNPCFFGERKLWAHNVESWLAAALVFEFDSHCVVPPTVSFGGGALVCGRRVIPMQAVCGESKTNACFLRQLLLCVCVLRASYRRPMPSCSPL